jgi:L-rhamnose isomerase
MPMFSNNDINYYRGEAIEHTRKMVNEIRSRGIKVLSYFVGDGGGYSRNDEKRDFKRMYGKDAEFIDINSVMGISKTMNEKFLEKN